MSDIDAIRERRNADYDIDGDPIEQMGLDITVLLAEVDRLASLGELMSAAIFGFTGGYHDDDSTLRRVGNLWDNRDAVDEKAS